MSQYIAVLDIHKFIFAVIVVLSHGHHLFTDGSYPFIGGGIAVDFFFLVSGSMLAKSVNNNQNDANVGKSTFHYIKRRITRVMPNFLIAWIIGFLLSSLSVNSLKTWISNLLSSVGELLMIDQTGFLNVRYNDVTWYISAMLLSSLLIYPLAVKNKDLFFYVISPLIFLFLFGYTYQNWDSICRLDWNGYCYNTIIRGLMEMTGGCICYKIGSYLSQFDFTVLGKILLGCCSWFPIILVIPYIFFKRAEVYSWYILLMFMVSLVGSISNKGTEAFTFSTEICKKLGDFSFSLYLGHGPWRWFLKDRLPVLWNNMTRYSVYLVISVISALFIMYISNFIKQRWHSDRVRIRRFVIK